MYDFVTENQSSVMKTSSHEMAISRSQIMATNSPTNSQPTHKDNESYYCHVPPELRRKIWDNEYVNLWEVLVEYRLSAAEVVVSEETGQARVERKAIKIDSLSKWIEAFGIYAAVYSVGRPHLAPHLFQYFTSICKYAETRPWDTVCEYDKDCRSEMARDSSKSWADFDILLWSHKRKPQNPPEPKTTGPPKSNTPSSDDDREEICMNYNYRYCRFGKGCFRQHKCLHCGKFGHPAQDCRN